MKDVRELALNPEQAGSLEQWQLFERDVKTFVDDTADVPRRYALAQDV